VTRLDFRRGSMENVKQTHTFTHNDEEYEIRVIQTEGGIKIKVYQDDKPANQWSYSINWDVAIQLDWSAISFRRAVSMLIETAKQDITSPAN